MKIISKGLTYKINFFPFCPPLEISAVTVQQFLFIKLSYGPSIDQFQKNQPTLICILKRSLALQDFPNSAMQCLHKYNNYFI